MVTGSFGFFKRKVIRALESAGFKGDAHELADSLDMSYDNIKFLPFKWWDQEIARELEEFRAENPHEFE